MLLTSVILAYRPFFDPLPIDSFWLLLMLPLSLAVALVYKAIKLDDLKQLPRASAILTAQIIFFMAVAAGGLWIITEIV